MTSHALPRALAVARIGIGLAIFMDALETSAILFHIADGKIAMPVTDFLPAPTTSLVMGYMAVLLISSVTMMLGLFTRTFGLLATAIQVCALLWDQQTYTHHAWLITLLTPLVALSACDRVWAVGAASRDRGPSAPWLPLLMMSQLSICYLFAALSKLSGEFLSGEHFEHWLRWPMASEVHLAIAVMTVVSELFLAVGFWFVRTRVLATVVGLGLHVAIVVLMNATYQLLTFAVASLCLYPLFHAVTVRGDRLNNSVPGRVVIWDSHCSFCRRWVALFRALDWLKFHRFVGSSDPGAFDDPRVTPELADQAIQLLTPDTHAQGFDAVRRILAVCPLTFWIAPVLWLPPVRRLGDAAYGRVAARRTCKVG